MSRLEEKFPGFTSEESEEPDSSQEDFLDTFDSNHSRTGIKDMRGNSLPYQAREYLKYELGERFDEYELGQKGKEFGIIKNLLNEFEVCQIEEMIRLIVWDWKAVQERFDYHARETPRVVDLMKLRYDLLDYTDEGVRSTNFRESNYRDRFC